MLRSYPLLARLIACLALAWQPSCARASEEANTQLWINLAADHKLDQRTTLILDTSLRWREDARGGEQRTLRAELMREIARGVRIGGGGALFETEDGLSELRPHQEVTLSRGRWSVRTRLEERFFDGADRMELRLRQQIRLAQPIDTHWQLALSGEYLGLLQTRSRNSSAPRDEWRARAVLSRTVSETVTLGLGYLLIHTPREGAPDRSAHIPQVNASFAF